MSKKINIAAILVVLFGASMFVEARPVTAKAVFKPAVGSAISRAVQKYADKNEKGIGKIKVIKSDVRGNWALVWGRAVQKRLDDAQYLLHREKGEWKVLVMGTSLEGTGAEYKVPPDLVKRWNL